MAWKGNARSRRLGEPRFIHPIERLEGRLFLSTTWTVSSLLDSATSPGTLRYDISNSVAGDVIAFDPTVLSADAQKAITLQGSQLEIAHNLTIEGPGSASLAISGNHTSRVFQVDSGVTATISGLTITSGNAGSSGFGGGITSWGTLNLLDAVVGSNTARLGGGIYTAGPLTLRNCSLLGNTASAHGGALYADLGADCTVTGSTIAGNSATNGGGMVNYEDSLSIVNDTIAQNTATNGPGGSAADDPTTHRRRIAVP